MFGLRQVGRCSVSMTRQIQPRAAFFSSSSLHNNSENPKDSSSTTTSSTTTSSSSSSSSSKTEDPFQQRSLGRGQKIQSMKNDPTELKRFTDSVQQSAPRFIVPPKTGSPKPTGPVFSAMQQLSDGPTRNQGAGRGRPTTSSTSGPSGSSSSSTSSPSQRKPMAIMDSRFRDAPSGPSNRGPRTLNNLDMLADKVPQRKNNFPSPDGRFPSGTRARLPQGRPFSRDGQRGPQGGNNLMRFGKSTPYGGRGGSQWGQRGKMRERKGDQDGQRKSRRTRGPGDSLLDDSLFDGPSPAADSEVTLDSYLNSEDVHPLAIGDYYTPHEKLAFQTFRIPEDDEYDYPSQEESLVFGGTESFTLGEVAHHGIDWKNFDKIPRVSNEKYFVNIEPLEEVNKTQFKTPEEFLSSIPKTHQHYKTLRDVYTLVDRNPWYNDAQKVNLLVQVSKEGVVNA